MRAGGDVGIGYTTWEKLLLVTSDGGPEIEGCCSDFRLRGVRLRERNARPPGDEKGNKKNNAHHSSANSAGDRVTVSTQRNSTDGFKIVLFTKDSLQV
jgi:hypothetical protein